MKLTRIMPYVLILVGLVLASHAHLQAAPLLTWEKVITREDGTSISNLTGYRLFRANKSLMVLTTAQAMADPSIAKISIVASTNSYELNGMQGGLTYYYRLAAYDSLGIQSGFSVDDSGQGLEISYLAQASD